MRWPDGRPRCVWANPRNPTYIAYHDKEWGVPVHDDGKLFEMLLLECFQAGLSWECILNKREAFREAFDGFDPCLISTYGEKDVERVLSQPGIVRNRKKTEAAIANANVFLSVADEFGSFSAYLWNGRKTVHEVGRTNNELSDTMSADLRRKGMRYLGTVTMYAYLQAVGVIESHEVGCFLHNVEHEHG